MFAAYSEATDEKPDILTKEEEKPSTSTEPAWLENVSYKPEVLKSEPVEVLSSYSSDEVEVIKVKRSKKLKKEKKKRKEKRKKELPEYDDKSIFVDPAAQFSANAQLFGEWKKRETENLMYGAMYSKHVPKYRPRTKKSLHSEQFWKTFCQKGKKKKVKPPRYFTRKLQLPNVVDGDSIHVDVQRDISFSMRSTLLPLPVECTTEKGTFLWNSESNRYDIVAKDGRVVDNRDGHTLDYNLRLTLDPHDVELWLEYVRSVDSAPGFSVDKTKGSNLSVLERKMAILEKAIHLNPQAVELYLEKMSLGKAGLLEYEKMIALWRDIEFRFPNACTMWRRRLQFDRESQYGRFNLNVLLKTYDRCLNNLNVIMTGQMITHKPEPESDWFFLQVLLERCQLLHDSGFEEKAIAAMQAIIEFNFCAPESVLHSKLEEKRQLFEMYWSEPLIPKFSEPGAIHWNSFIDAGGRKAFLLRAPESPESDYENIEKDLLESALELPQKWLTIEKLRMSYFFYPWRGKDDEEPADPDRIVLFDDISPFLFDLFSSEHKFWLLVELSQMLGCSLPHFLYQPFGNLHFSQAAASFDFYRPLERSLQNAETYRTAFFEQCDKLLNDDHRLIMVVIRLYTIADGFHSTGNVKQFRSAAKPVLESESNRQSCVLFCVFAECLLRLGGVAHFEKTFVATLRTLGESNIAALSHLERTYLLNMMLLYAETSFDSKKSDNVGWILSVINFEPFSTVIAKLASSSDTLFDQEVLRKRCVRFVRTLTKSPENLALSFQLCGSNFGIAVKLCMFVKVHSSVQNMKALFEELADVGRSLRSRLSGGARSVVISEFADFCAKYLSLLTKASKAPEGSVLAKKELKQVTVDLLTEAPASWPMLRSLAEAHLSSYLFTDLRRILSAISKNDDSGQVHLVLLWAEVQRLNRLMNENPQQPGFNAGLNNLIAELIPRFGALQEFWLFYISFLHKMAPNNLVAEIPRIVTHCPWSKALLFRLLELDSEHWQSHIDHLTLSQLRVRLPIEELELLVENT